MSTKRLAIFEIDRAGLHRALQLPDDVEIVGIFDDQTTNGRFLMKIEGGQLKEVREGHPIPHVHPIITRHVTDNKESWEFSY